MDNASKNAGEMIDKLQMKFNSKYICAEMLREHYMIAYINRLALPFLAGQRQAVITNELVDIIVRIRSFILLSNILADYPALSLTTDRSFRFVKSSRLEQYTLQAILIQLV